MSTMEFSRMSGSEVSGCIDLVTAAFVEAAEWTSKISRRYKKRKGERSGHERLLFEVLSRGSAQIRSTYDQGCQRCGGAYKSGDDIARERLLCVAIQVHTDIIGRLQIASEEEKATVDWLKLHEIAVIARHDTLQSLEELSQKLGASSPGRFTSRRNSRYSFSSTIAPSVLASSVCLPGMVPVSDTSSVRSGFKRVFSSSSSGSSVSSTRPRSSSASTATTSWSAAWNRAWGGTGSPAPVKTVSPNPDHRRSTSLGPYGNLAHPGVMNHGGRPNIIQRPSLADCRWSNDYGSVMDSPTRPQTAISDATCWPHPHEYSHDSAMVSPLATTNKLEPSIVTERDSDDSSSVNTRDYDNESIYSQAEAATPTTPITEPSNSPIASSPFKEFHTASFPITPIHEEEPLPSLSPMSSASTMSHEPPASGLVHPAFRLQTPRQAPAPPIPAKKPRVAPQILPASPSRLTPTISTSDTLPHSTVTTYITSRPNKRNNYHNFCKGAWETRERATSGLQVRFMPNGWYGRAPFWTCKQCHFRSQPMPLSALAQKMMASPIGAFGSPRVTEYQIPDRIYVSSSGIAFRWLFLARSHVRCKDALAAQRCSLVGDAATTPRANSTTTMATTSSAASRREDMSKTYRADSEIATISAGFEFGCIFCSVEGRESAVYPDVEALLGHVEEWHAGQMSKETLSKTRCIDGRVADKREEWDVNICRFDEFQV